eukprot:TRINITY_DN100257_c0_g1_i1.p2 TRINITY_DN100257_c0_g1~~TRINITY_DN100257_c0_g1_i1.p2  ORF type:complete len:123 (-),score=29.86 TRINITY_DN100257_c0_g1_i1:62-430(-)
MGKLGANPFKAPEEPSGFSPERAYALVQAEAQAERQLLANDAVMLSPKKNKPRADEGKMFETFTRFDANKDGYMERGELRLMMKELCGKDLGEAELDAMMEQIDHNKDGRIDFREFAAFMNL